MKTDIYGLLGMVKDGKAPKKIYYKNEIFEYDEKEKDYVHIDFTEYLFDVYLITDILNDEVEILETTITMKENYYQYQPYTGEVEIKCNSPKYLLESNKIQKLDILKQNGKTYLESYCYRYPPLEKLPLSNEEITFVSKINEIIDKLNKEKYL